MHGDKIYRYTVESSGAESIEQSKIQIIRISRGT